MIKAEGYRQRLERELGLSFLNLIINSSRLMIICVFFGNMSVVSNSAGTTNGAISLPVLVSSVGLKVNRFTRSLFRCSRQRAVRRWENLPVVQSGLMLNGTSPYDFYQYWINVDDRDVSRFLAYFTFLADGRHPTTRCLGR